MVRKILTSLVLVAAMGLLMAPLTACSPEVGSKEWCEDMKKKDKGDWSANEAKDFAKHCVL